MAEQLTLDAEFLRRALAWGGENDGDDVEVTPGTLPAGFPVTLPELAGLRVLGGVRSVPRGWTSAYSGGAHTAGAARVQWRVFLDVPAPQPQVMAALLEQFEAEGWQESQLFRQVFVEAARSAWQDTALEPPRVLAVQARQAESVTQLDLTLTDLDAEQVAHQRGHPPHPHFRDHFEAPLPILTLPDGWKGQMQSGQGGPICSQTHALWPPPGTAPDLAALLSQFLPQLGRQSWRLLHREDAPESLSVFRTPLGVGTLTLQPQEGRVSALIVHATAEEGRGSRTLVSIP